MTIERAIEILQDWLELDRQELGGKIESDYDRFVAEKDEALEVALEAMEYRKAKTPADDFGETHVFYKSLCPRCGNFLEYWGKKCCERCGQKLLWWPEAEETEDEI